MLLNLYILRKYSLDKLSFTVYRVAGLYEEGIYLQRFLVVCVHSIIYITIELLSQGSV